MCFRLPDNVKHCRLRFDLELTSAVVLLALRCPRVQILSLWPCKACVCQTYTGTVLHCARNLSVSKVQQCGTAVGTCPLDLTVKFPGYLRAAQTLDSMWLSAFTAFVAGTTLNPQNRSF